MAQFELINRTLKEVRFNAKLRDTKYWIECYLNEDTLAPKRYTVVERIDVNSRGGNNDFTFRDTDDLAEAEAWYAAAEVRVKAAITEALR